MIEFFKTILAEPLAVKIIFAVVGVVVINLLVRVLQRTVSVHMESKEIRYSMRRSLTFLGYLASIILVLLVFVNQLGSITVALGVAGAGIAFALQEVIISIAGWIALSFGQF
jgi:small-conductance mechanosensitive channel